jgi:hypothetical protein
LTFTNTVIARPPATNRERSGAAGKPRRRSRVGSEEVAAGKRRWIVTSRVDSRCRSQTSFLHFDTEWATWRLSPLSRESGFVEATSTRPRCGTPDPSLRSRERAASLKLFLPAPQNGSWPGLRSRERAASLKRSARSCPRSWQPRSPLSRESGFVEAVSLLNGVLRSDMSLRSRERAASLKLEGRIQVCRSHQRVSALARERLR